jgi:hypothetical protein
MRHYVQSVGTDAGTVKSEPSGPTPGIEDLPKREAPDLRSCQWALEGLNTSDLSRVKEGLRKARARPVTARIERVIPPRSARVRHERAFRAARRRMAA